MIRNKEVATGSPTVDPERPTPMAQTSLSKDQIFHLLQNERRRLALTYLRNCEGEVSMRDVAEQVAAWEHDTTVQALDSDQRQRVYIPLYQNHLPKLDEEGVIVYDQSRGIVERTPVADQLDPYLTDDEATVESPAPDDATERDRWARYYLGTSAVGVALLGATALQLPPFGGLPLGAIGVAMVLAFSLLSLAHVSATRTAPNGH